jgi:hypothetical protein
MKKQMEEARAKFDNPEFKEQMKKLNSPEFKMQLNDELKKTLDIQKQIRIGQAFLDLPQFSKQMEELQTTLDNPEFKKNLDQLNSDELRRELSGLHKQIDELREQLRKDSIVVIAPKIAPAPTPAVP